MKSLFSNILFWLFLGGAVGITLLITGVFGGANKPDKNLYNKLLESYQQRIDEEKDRTKSEINFRLEQKEEYEGHLYNDSVLYSKYQANQTKYVVVNNKLNDIPNTIRRIANSDDSIRAAFARQ